MPEWLVERGIGETRLVLADDDGILAARILPDDQPIAGAVLPAKLTDVGRYGRNARAEAAGRTYLLPKGAPGVTQGRALTIEVTREALGSPEPWKLPLARVSDEAPRDAALPDATELVPNAPTDRLATLGWDELLDEARTGLVTFPGGSLTISPTPAMTLVDVDGALPLAELAVAGAKAAGAAIRRLGIAGSVGLDFPTVGSKDARTATVAALDAAMGGEKFERTAMNGFGFVQLVRPRVHASLLELAADRPAFEARALLRRAGRLTGSVTLGAHPAVIAAIRPDWVAALARQVGGAVTLQADAKRAMAAGDAFPA